MPQAVQPKVSTSIHNLAPNGPDFDPDHFTDQLSADNARTLVESGIPLDYAVHSVGVYSAAEAKDLPQDLTDRHYALPGTVFPLRSVDGSVIHQIRRDRVAPARPGRAKPAKYLQPSGTGSLITIHPNQSDRVDKVSEVWIVEGTKQAICASFYAPEEVLVVGIQGCQNWQHEGTAVPDVSQIVLDGMKVVIFFDADRATKRSVYDAGVSLASFLTNLGASEVRYSARAGNGSAGLDDVLGSLPLERRAKFLANLALQSTPSTKPGRRPAAPTRKTAKQAALCDMTRGVTVKMSEDGEPGLTLLDAAARIDEVVNMADPDNPDRVIAPILHLEVAISNGEDSVEKFPAVVTSDRLTDPGSWLDQHPESAAISVARPSDLADRTDIANAIRDCEHDDTRSVHAVPRTGWTAVNGEWRYLHQGGALGSDGNTTSWRSHLPLRFRCIDYSDAVPDAVDPDVLRKAVRDTVVKAPGYLVDSTLWWAGLGAAAMSESGAVPKTALSVVAEKSSGKTLCLTTLTAMLTPKFAYENTLMFSADGTANAIDLSMNGLDNCFLLVDDWHPEQDPRERFRQSKALDQILRRCHGAPSKARGVVDRQVDGVVLAPVNNSHPALLLSMERLPARQDAESMLDRVLTLSIKASDTFRGNDAQKMAELGKNGSMQVANTGYLMWLAGQVNGMDAETPEQKMAAWKKWIGDNREATAKDMRTFAQESTPRGTQVAASMHEGVALWLTYALEIGAITEEEQAEIGNNSLNLLLEACVKHTELALGGNPDDSVRVIRTLKAAVAAGELILSGVPSGGQRRLGKFHQVGNQHCVAILASRDFAGMDKSTIEGGLRPVAIQAVDGDRIRYTHQVSFPTSDDDDASADSGRIRCYCVPIADWESA